MKLLLPLGLAIQRFYALSDWSGGSRCRRRPESVELLRQQPKPPLRSHRIQVPCHVELEQDVGESPRAACIFAASASPQLTAVCIPVEGGQGRDQRPVGDDIQTRGKLFDDLAV